MMPAMQPLRLALALAVALWSGAGDRTWTGQISDSACGIHHEETAEGAGRLSPHDCTLACVRGGSKYVLVSAGTVLPIANQDFAGLAESAGRTVKVAGTLQNGALVVTKIDKAD
jgi:hypothetical protein